MPPRQAATQAGIERIDCGCGDGDVHAPERRERRCQRAIQLPGAQCCFGRRHSMVRHVFA
jgi:hypothetical protein